MNETQGMIEVVGGWVGGGGDDGMMVVCGVMESTTTSNRLKLDAK